MCTWSHVLIILSSTTTHIDRLADLHLALHIIVAKITITDKIKEARFFCLTITDSHGHLVHGSLSLYSHSLSYDMVAISNFCEKLSMCKFS